MVVSDFHLRLQRVREKRGLTQEQASHKAGVSLRYYQDLEQGRKLPSMDKLGEILQGFGLTAGQFFQDEPSLYSIPDFSTAGDFLAKFSSLSPNLQKVVLAIVYKDPGYASDLPEAFGSLGRSLGPLLKAQG